MVKNNLCSKLISIRLNHVSYSLQSLADLAFITQSPADGFLANNKYCYLFSFSFNLLFLFHKNKEFNHARFVAGVPNKNMHVSLR